MRLRNSLDRALGTHRLYGFGLGFIGLGLGPLGLGFWGQGRVQGFGFPATTASESGLSSVYFRQIQVHYYLPFLECNVRLRCD